jgi:hypothetical protein
LKEVWELGQRSHMVHQSFPLCMGMIRAKLWVLEFSTMATGMALMCLGLH